MHWMLKVLKNKLSEYVRLAASGETILLRWTRSSRSSTLIAASGDLPRHLGARARSIDLFPLDSA